MLRCIGACLCVAFAMGLAGPAHAAQERRDTLEALERERLQLQRDELHRQEYAPGQLSSSRWRSPVAGESPCFRIDEIVLGADGLDQALLPRFAELLVDLDEFRKSCLGVQSLEALRANLQDRLHENGYLTSRIELPPQNLSAGRLQLKLHLGRVAGYRVVVNGGESGYVPANALGFASGDLLRRQDIEQTLENLGRLRSQAAQFQIEPGPELDTSVIAIQLAGGREWGINLGIDNAAAQEFGRYQYSLNGSLDNPLGRADQLSLNLSRTRRAPGGDAQQRSLLLSYSLPVGRHLLSANVSRTTHGRSIQGASTVFAEEGFDASVQLRWQWTAWRTANVRQNIWMGLVTRRARNFVEDTELLLQRRRSKSMEAGFNTSIRWGDAQLEFSGECAQGLRVSPDPDLDTPPPELPRVSRLQLSLLAPLRPPAWLGASAWGYQARAQVHHVEHPAYASDLATLGGRWTVRGISDTGLIAGRSVLSVQQELQLPWRALALQTQMQPFVALDLGGELKSVQADTPERRMAGAALGLRFAREHLNAEIVLARPLYNGGAAEAGGTQVYLNLFASY
ncbi:ShlB/FhaC/HecB family hemolysin secretion/activation protein [Paucibacter sp. APW11]|uniref:ShlB/FhaC/HecB family hemolysin secretion/activation protein n=1 Tax=Roseateles aquae TaxID=3077235 RepID=A0ABU3PDG7_9BURK|nr:ShlB/FhaC/HecB family hemolysin secretion/activation protein [Paucibacter sp. APW11]MDT9000573.1 ShlB/FhaC/HecB family hemolysin secretion/activation protein [Paucibacter sp. APW11]